MERTRLDGADFEAGTGSVHLVGGLTLNYDKVQLVADIDLASLKGTGHLVLIEEAGGVKNSKDPVTANDGTAAVAVAEQHSPEAGEAEEAKVPAAQKKRKANGARVA